MFHWTERPLALTTVHRPTDAHTHTHKTLNTQIKKKHKANNEF